MDKEIRKKLIDMAHKGVPHTNYQALSNLLGLGYDMGEPHHRSIMGDDLGEVSAYEHDRGRPLISALVIHKNTKDQGDGFFKLCEELKIGGGKSWEQLKRDKAFEKKCREDCFDFWKNKENYLKYKDD